MTSEQAFSIGHVMGRGRVPNYTKSDWLELYTNESAQFATYMAAYRKGTERYVTQYGPLTSNRAGEER